MRRRWITLGILFACVAALGLFAWLKPPRQQDVTHVVSDIKAADASLLRVLRKGKPLASLEKRGNEWFVTQPVAAPADALQVSRLLAVLDAKSPQRYPSAQLDKFELQEPQAEIVINDQRFAFGAINNVTREQYLLARGQVYAVEPRFAAAIPGDATALLRRTVLAASEVPQRFEFGAFTVSADDKKWSTTPSTPDVSQDDYNRWVAQWRDGSALRAERADTRKPERELVITLKDGRRVTLAVLQKQPELIVRRADVGLQFVFVGDIGAQMISTPGRPK